MGNLRKLIWFIFLLSVVPFDRSLRASEEGHILGLEYALDSIPASSIESPSFFKTTVHTQTGKTFKTTEEIIGQTTGVDIDNFGGLGTLSTVSIRGSSSSQVNILLNGIKINSPSNQTVDISSLPLGHASQIDIIRGGSSAEYGDGGIGGTINIITGVRDGSHAILSLNAGSFGTTSLGFSTNKTAERYSYLVSSSFLGSKGDFKFRNINSTPNNPDDDYTDWRQNNSFNSFGLFAGLSFKPTEDLRLNAANEFYYSDKGIPGNTYFPSLFSKEKGLRDILTLGIGSKKIFKNTDMNVTLASKIDKLGFEDPQGELTGIALKTDRIGYDFSADFLFDIYPSRNNLFTLGIGAAYYGLDQNANGTSVTPCRINPHLSLKEQLTVLKGRLTVSPILRLDLISNFSDQSGSDLIFTPKLGILGNPLKGLDVKLNFGTSYRYPDFNELYFSEGFIEGNPDLKKEKAINFDLGFRYSLRFLFVEIVYFLNGVSDIIVYEQLSNFRYKPLNIGKALIQGVEFSGSLHPFPFMKFSVNTAFMDPRNRSGDPNKEGNLLPGRPRNKTNARVSLFDSHREIWTEFQAIGSNYVNEANTVELGSRYILNLGFSFKYRLATFSIEIKNLTSNRIEDVRGFPLPGVSFMGGVSVEI